MKGVYFEVQTPLTPGHSNWIEYVREPDLMTARIIKKELTKYGREVRIVRCHVLQEIEGIEE